MHPNRNTAEPTAGGRVTRPPRTPATLGLVDDDDPLPPPDYTSPPPGAGDSLSDMDISPLAGFLLHVSGRIPPCGYA